MIRKLECFETRLVTWFATRLFSYFLAICPRQLAAARAHALDRTMETLSIEQFRGNYP